MMRPDKRDAHLSFRDRTTNASGRNAKLEAHVGARSYTYHRLLNLHSRFVLVSLS